MTPKTTPTTPERTLPSLPPPCVTPGTVLFGLRDSASQFPYIVEDLETGMRPRLVFARWVDAWEYCRWAFGGNWVQFVSIETLTDAESVTWHALQAAIAAYDAFGDASPALPPPSCTDDDLADIQTGPARGVANGVSAGLLLIGFLLGLAWVGGKI